MVFNHFHRNSYHIISILYSLWKELKKHVERRCLWGSNPSTERRPTWVHHEPNVQRLEKPASKETMWTNWWFQPLEKYESQIGSSSHQPVKRRAKIQPGLLSNVQRKWSNGCTVQDISANHGWMDYVKHAQKASKGKQPT